MSRHAWYTPSGILSRTLEKLARRIRAAKPSKKMSRPDMEFIAMLFAGLYGSSEVFGAYWTVRVASYQLFTIIRNRRAMAKAQRAGFRAPRGPSDNVSMH